MCGWALPPPTEPQKTANQFRRERERKVRWLTRHGYLRSEAIREALLKVAREDFILRSYRDYAYREVPLPLPGQSATISCPHSYPLFYEPLGLARGHRFLEIGLGSGYGTALAREVVGDEGLVVSVEIDPLTFEFARQNLERAGYRDIVLARADGGRGFEEEAPYDRICLTAACPEPPAPLFDQLDVGGRLIGPVIRGGRGEQDLIVFESSAEGIRERVICQVLYVSLQGAYGTRRGAGR
jgi:protein-L-isoaspartate(D-aspartate) O-methyltransferase